MRKHPQPYVQRHTCNYALVFIIPSSPPVPLQIGRFALPSRADVLPHRHDYPPTPSLSKYYDRRCDGNQPFLVGNCQSHGATEDKATLRTHSSTPVAVI